MKTITLKENLINIMKGLVEQLNKASEAYYSGHAEIMSDKEWNDKFDKLTALEKETGVILPDSPTHNVSTAVQTQAEDSKLIKVQHEYAALSLAKTKSIDDLVKWADGKVINMSWKLDGLTLVATYDNGRLSKLVTRGDGIIGNLVTHLASAIEGVELTIPCKDHIVIRGEAVISYTDFNDYIERTGASYENPRNLAAGSFNISSGELQENLERIKERHVRWSHLLRYILEIKIGSSYHGITEWTICISLVSIRLSLYILKILIRKI